MRRIAVLAGLVILGAATRAEAQLPSAVARLIDTRGRNVGMVRLQETPSRGVLLQVEVSGLAPGPHGIHIHEVGRCDPPSFESAGPHFDPGDRTHGSRSANPMHAGDLTNLEVPGPGRIEAERIARGVTLRPGAPNSLLDADGSAVVIHAEPDDYVSQPSGNSGARVVCGVIQPAR